MHVPWQCKRNCNCLHLELQLANVHVIASLHHITHILVYSHAYGKEHMVIICLYIHACMCGSMPMHMIVGVWLMAAHGTIW